MRQLPVYTETLNAQELAFIYRKERLERSQLYKVLRGLMILSFAIPFIVAWIRALTGANDPFDALQYFLSVVILLGISCTAVYMAYRRSLRLMRNDIRLGTKTVERAHITRKLYMPQNNSYHFYIDSPTRISIETNEADYSRLQQGDEVNIEYTTHSKLYLGYF